MIYIIGKITYISQNYIYLESNYIGRKIFIKQNEKVILNKITKIYVWELMVESSKGQSFKQLYGFLSFNDFILFNKLITLPSIGPKTAMVVLDNDTDLVTKLILDHDIKGLSALKGISEKIANIIVNNISIILNNKNMNTNNKEKEDEKNTLK